jgi:hypothetical protein
MSPNVNVAVWYSTVPEPGTVPGNVKAPARCAPSLLGTVPTSGNALLDIVSNCQKYSHKRGDIPEFYVVITV